MLRETFARFLDGPRPSHAQILAVTSDPRGALAAAPAAPAPGSRCPLCAFPTYDWAVDLERLPAGVLARIRSSFPGWSPGCGACRECVDRYRLVACA